MSNAKTVKALAAAAVAAAGVATTGAASPASAATARPHGFVPRPGPVAAASATPRATERIGIASISACAPSFNPWVCGRIEGYSSYVYNMQIDECAHTSGIWMHGEIVSPNGHFVRNTHSYYRSNFNCAPWSTFSFFRTVTPGWWQFRTWEKISAHDYVRLETLYLQVLPK